MTQKGGPCYRGQQLRDNIPCQAVVNLDSGALLFPRHRALLVQAKSDRYANGSPSGGAGERSETERASPSPESRHAAINCLFDRAMLSLCLFFSVSILALSVTFGDSSPKGRAFRAAFTASLPALSAPASRCRCACAACRSGCAPPPRRRWRWRGAGRARWPSHPAHGRRW